MQEKLSYKDVSYFGAGRLLIPDDMQLDSYIKYENSSSGRLVSILDACEIYKGSTFLSNDPIPHWWEKAVEQSICFVLSDKSTLIVRLPDNAFLVAGFYSESFYLWLETLESEDVAYDRFLGGVLIYAPEWPEETNTKLTQHNVQATEYASEYISPLTERSKKLQKVADKAIKEGFELPNKNLFPSSRTLLSHQEPVVLALAKQGGGILADDVGSGKSSMFICGYLSLIQKQMLDENIDLDNIPPLVISTMKSLVDPISEEFDKWFNGVKIHKIKSKKNYDIPEDTQVIVVPITSLDKALPFIEEAMPGGVIFDESHMVKSMNSKRTKAAVNLAKFVRKNNDNPYIVCASATPMPNRPSELWSQLVIAGMSDDIIEYAKSKQTFPKTISPSTRNRYSMKVNDGFIFDMRYCEGKPSHWGWDNKGSSHEEELSEFLYNNGLIRRKKFEFITPLPLLHQHFINVPISFEDKEKYSYAEEEFTSYLVGKVRRKSQAENWSPSRLRKEITNALEKALGNSNKNGSEGIMKMTDLRMMVEEMKIPGTIEWIKRFFAGDPAIVGKNHRKRKKLIVFVHHKEAQQKLINNPELQEFGMLSILSDTKNVNDVVAEFQEWDSDKDLLILYSGAQAGLTLTAAMDVLILGLPFSYYNVIQMAGRVWARISEDYPPHEAHIHYTNSGLKIDQYMIDLIKQKAWLSKTIIDGETAVDVLNEAESPDFNGDENDNIKNIVSEMISGELNIKQK